MHVLRRSATLLVPLLLVACTRLPDGATAGAGSPGRLLMEALKIDAGIDVTMVPYKGTAIALGELVGGQVDAIFAAVPSVNTHYKAGRVRAIAITSEQRSSIVPGVPTMSEVLPGFRGEAWMGLLAPAKTPPAIVAKLSKAVSDFLQEPSVQKYFGEQFITASYKNTIRSIYDFIEIGQCLSFFNLGNH